MWTWQYSNITTTATTVVASGPCEFIGLTVNTGASLAVATVYDNTAGSGNKIATIDASATGNFAYGVRCKKGLTVVTSGGNADITIAYA